MGSLKGLSLRNKILIYCDYGCSDITNLHKELERCFQDKGIEISEVDASGIIKENALNEEVLAFFMPGGASTPYRQKLKEYGNDKIAEYVKNGGVYFGICAGAYYACDKINFEMDVPELRLERTGMNLINAAAVGTLYKELGIAPYSPDTSSAMVVDIRCEDDGAVCAAYYHGGPYFDISEDKECEVLGTYENVKNHPPAIIAKKYGKGMVLASGVHLEDSGERLGAAIHKLRKDRDNALAIAEQLKKREISRQILFNKMMNRIR